MPAHQACFLMLQITSNIKNVKNEIPRIPQKALKIHLGTLKGPPERTTAPNGHQTGAKVVPQDPQMLQLPERDPN